MLGRYNGPMKIKGGKLTMNAE